MQPRKHHRRRRIGILGGTFNPPHLAHLVIAEECRQNRDLDEVWFLPTGRPPHKKVPQLADGKLRVSMLEELIQAADGLSVCPVELDRPGPSYTVDTLEALHQRHPAYDWYFIIGSDMITYFNTWHRFHDLQNLVTFITVMRPGYTLDDLPQFHSCFSPAAWRKLQRFQTVTPQMEISSTKIRERIRQHRPVWHLTGHEVASFIDRHSLYV